MRVGILTGGGDCPGLNAVIRAIVRKGIRVHGDEMVGVLDGYQGLVDRRIQPLDVESLRGKLPIGGTILGTSRYQPFMDDDGVDRVRSCLADARAEYQTFLHNGDAQRPAAFRGMRPVLTPLTDLITGDVRATLLSGIAAVGLLLLIACVNVANLLLVHGTARVQEIAIRRALGAGSRRVIRQLLTETGLLALVGGVLGTLLALWAVAALVQLAPPELPRRDMIGIDGRVLLFTCGITAMAALLSGVLPAVLSAVGDLRPWLRGERRTTSGASALRGLRHGLVIGQIAVAILVVVSAGLLLRSLIELQSADMGFNEESLVLAGTSLPPDIFPGKDRQLAALDEVLTRVGALPGVVSVASVVAEPFSGQAGWSATYSAEGQTADAQAHNPMVNLESVGPEYFPTMQLPILRGRAFTSRDRQDTEPVIIVSDAVARRTWPGDDPIGKRVKLGPAEGPGEWHSVVGVVSETRYRNLEEPPLTLYLPTRQFGPMPMKLAIRSSAEPARLTSQIRDALRQVHPEWRVVRAGSIRQLKDTALSRPQFSTVLLGTFAALTLLLAAIGLYGVLAATVRQRTREIGIRIALGAESRGIARLVLRQGLALGAAGTLLGLAGALATTRVLRSLLFGVSPADPLTLAAVASLFVIVILLASWLPAHRAARVDPIIALREEH